MRDGEDGFMVVTPLERDPDGDGTRGTTTVLVNRGWVARKLRRQRDRVEGLPTGEVVVEGLLREPWKKNMFTPENRPDKGEFYFPDVSRWLSYPGARLCGSSRRWVRYVTFMLQTWDRYFYADIRVIASWFGLFYSLRSTSADMGLPQSPT